MVVGCQGGCEILITKPEKMLDFYLIHNGQAKPGHPDQTGFIGALGKDVFERLVRKDVIPDRFVYYSDLRWGTALIKQMQQAIHQKQMQSDTDVRQILGLLDQADKNQSGLIAYGD